MGGGASTQLDGMPCACGSVDRSQLGDVGGAGLGMAGGGQLHHSGGAQRPRCMKSGI